MAPFRAALRENDVVKHVVLGAVLLVTIAIITDQSAVLNSDLIG
jgi:hypothetical protein